MPDRATPIVLELRSPARAPRSRRARSSELGYHERRVAAGGFARLEAERPRVDRAAPARRRATRARYSRHILIPEVGEAGPAQAARLARSCCSAPAASARPPRCTSPRPASARSASSTPTSSTRRTCSGRCCTPRPHRHAEDRSARSRRCAALNPDVKVIEYQERLTLENVDRDHRRLRRHRRRHRQLPHALPAERREPQAPHPRRARLDLPLRGPAHACSSRTTGPCYRCLFPEPPPPELAPSCAEGGVLGVLPGIMGSLQAAEAIKLLLGIGDSLVGRLMMFDALEMTFQRGRAAPRPGLPGLRRGRRPDRVHRLRAVLRRCRA